MKYRKKPIVIDAVQWDGTLKTWLKIYHELGLINSQWEPGEMGSETFSIRTIDGNLALIKKSTWVCKGIVGELYPCSAEIFEATYENAATIGPDEKVKGAQANL